LCAHQQLWGKAQSYLEASLAVAPGRSAHLELAQLLDQLGRPDEANRHYRAAVHCDAQASDQASQLRGGRKSV
jgi:HemY protein